MRINTVKLYYLFINIITSAKHYLLYSHYTSKVLNRLTRYSKCIKIGASLLAAVIPNGTLALSSCEIKRTY